MRIYVAHSKKYDFKNELYLPIRSSSLNSLHDFTLPHEKSDLPFNSRDFIPTCDLVIAEVSYAGTGIGIELGWADAAKVPIVCIYKKGTDLAGSLKVVTSVFLEYSSTAEMIDKVQMELEKFHKENG